jgi:hypothetical protein
VSCRIPFKVYTNHQVLQYFAIKRMLNSRQAAWNEFLAPFRYTLYYRPGKQNLIADLLSRKAQDLVIQKAVKKWSRTQMLLPSDRFAKGAPLAEVLVLLPDPKNDQKDLSAEDLSGPQL